MDLSLDNASRGQKHVQENILHFYSWRNVFISEESGKCACASD
jgi:hypothetical protein